MNNVILITGGSRGIGAATARLAAQRGYAVCCSYLRDLEAANGVVNEIMQAGGTALAIQADVSVEADVIRLFKAIDHSLGPVTALVNNAGIVEQQMRVEHMDAARLTGFLRLTLQAPFCARAKRCAGCRPNMAVVAAPS